MNYKFNKFPLQDENGNWILYEHEMKVLLRCETCGCEEESNVYFTNHIPDPKLSLEYEFGSKKEQKRNFLWICDCEGSMYIKQIIEIYH